MATIEQELKSFTQFVEERIGTSDSEQKLAELFDLWMFENPVDADYTENVAAVNASIQDFNNGERGTPAGEHSAELRKEFGISEE